jgi:hypothetical protein
VAVDPEAPIPPVDFIFVIDTTVSMRRDLQTWVPPNLAPFPAELAAAGVDDYRLAITRYGTNRKQHFAKGPQDPDIAQDWTSDPNTWIDMILDLQNDIRNSTEAGGEAIWFALDNLQCRPNALCNVILYTDEDDDSPACSDKKAVPSCPTSLPSGSVLTDDFEGREPPGKGPIVCKKKPQSRVCAKWKRFQERTDLIAARLISEQVQLNLVINPRNKPSTFQYGDPECSITDPNGLIEPAPTLACLVDRVKTADGGIAGVCGSGGTCTATPEKVGQPCVVDDDCLPLSLQAQLLRSGVCGSSNICTGGRVGSVCVEDADCAIIARAYAIPTSPRKADEFFPVFIQDKIREQFCQVPP